MPGTFTQKELGISSIRTKKGQKEVVDGIPEWRKHSGLSSGWTTVGNRELQELLLKQPQDKFPTMFLRYDTYVIKLSEQLWYEGRPPRRGND